MNPFAIGKLMLGAGHPVYVAFEIGPTMRGLGSALRLTQAAAAARADAIKVQILDAQRLVGDPALTVVWREAGDGACEAPMREVLGRRALSRDQWRALRRDARERGLDFIATVDFPETLAIAVDLAADALKVCSGDVTHTEWVKEVAAAGVPIMIDTGSATLGDVERAVEACLSAGNPRLVIHHCPTGYPARLGSVNLRVLTTLRQMFPDFPIAFSDHVSGFAMDVAAVALGASMIEKTLTEDCQTPGPEHVMSIEPHEAAGFVQQIRDVEQALGHPRRRLSAEEEAGKQRARRSLYAARDLAAGEALTPDAVEWRRPGGGIGPAAWLAMAAAGIPRCRHAVGGGERIEWGAIL